MRSSEERIRFMHLRAAGLKKKRDRRLLFAAGCVSAGLFVILLGMTLYLQGMSRGYTEESFTASSLLSDNTGGYVLVAVIGFILGALTVTYMRKYHIINKKGRMKK